MCSFQSRYRPGQVESAELSLEHPQDRLSLDGAAGLLRGLETAPPGDMEGLRQIPHGVFPMMP